MKKKGFEYLIDAVSHLSTKATLAIAGTGDLASELETRAREAHVADRVRFLGNVTQDAVGSWFAAADVAALKHRTFYGREKDDVVYPIALANLVLHGIDEPHIWHGNRRSIYSGG